MVIRNAHHGWSYLAKFQNNDMGEKAAAIPSYAESKGTNKAERIASWASMHQVQKNVCWMTAKAARKKK